VIGEVLTGFGIILGRSSTNIKPALPPQAAVLRQNKHFRWTSWGVGDVFAILLQSKFEVEVMFLSGFLCECQWSRGQAMSLSIVLEQIGQKGRVTVLQIFLLLL